MPTKRLPKSASLKHLKHQARDLLSELRAGQMSAYQRIREFHPKCAGLPDAAIARRSFSLSDAQLSIAREYGYASWPRLREAVAEARGEDVDLIHNERIDDAVFAQALDFLDEGNATELQRLLRDTHGLVRQRVVFEGDNYFTNPSLLEFVAENPVRHGRLPENIVEIARLLLEAGAKDDRDAVEATLGLVASGRVAREQGAQRGLLELLCAYGAYPGTAMQAALAHGEFAAAETLIGCGAKVDLVAAAALNREAAVAALVPGASPEALQMALSLSALHGHAGVVAMLLDAGADPNRYNPEGANSHCTPLHSAALEGHMEAVKTLVAGGARRDIPDIHHRGMAADWAAHGGHDAIAAYLTSQESPGS